MKSNRTDTKGSDKETENSAKKTYEAPSIQSEALFETAAGGGLNKTAQGVAEGFCDQVGS